MIRTRSFRGSVAALMVMAIATLGLAIGPATTAASADTIVPVHLTINASTHLKKLNMDVVVPPGTLDAQINLTTGDLTGTLTLPPAKQDIALAGIPLASATFAIKAQPITGHLDLAGGTVSVHTAITFLITNASASLLPKLNLVGNHCQGSSPINVDFNGPFSLTGASTFTSTFTIPKFQGCGLLTPILNLVIPGPGNTFTSSLVPPTT